MAILDPGLRSIGRALLLALLDAPVALTEGELRREVEIGTDFGEADCFERALAELARTGLVNREGACLWASRAARAFSELDAG